MTGYAEVKRLKRRLDATFERVGNISSALRDGDAELELRSDFAKYLCVLVSGYIEKAVAEFVVHHARQTGVPTLLRYVEGNMKRSRNPKIEWIKSLLGSFDPEWRTRLETSLVDGQTEAINSIVDLRNKIAHGGSVGLTYSQIKEYYRQAQGVVEQVGKITCKETPIK